MNFQTNIFSEAWSVCRALKDYISCLCAICALFLVGDFAGIIEYNGLSASFIWPFLAFYTYKFLLGVEGTAPEDNKRSLGFLARSHALTFASGALAGSVGGVLLATVGLSTELFLSLTVGLIFICFCLLGTWLPAYVVGDTGGICAAFERGKRQIGYIASRLIVASVTNCLLFIIVIGPLIGFLKLLHVFELVSPVFLATIAKALVMGITIPAAAYLTILIAVIFTRAFFRDQHWLDHEGPIDTTTTQA